MARTTNPPRDLVPLADCRWLPHFHRDDARAAWLAGHGVETYLDFNDRTCVTLEDAYRLRDELQAEAARAEARRLADAEKLRARILEAQQRRQATWTKHYLTEVSRRGSSTAALHDARKEAWILTRIAERRLPDDVARQLGPVVTDGLPGSAQFHMLGATLLSLDDLARIDGAPIQRTDLTEGF